MLDGFPVFQLEAGEAGFPESGLAVQQEGANTAAGDLGRNGCQTGAHQVHFQGKDKSVATDNVDHIVQHLHEHGGTGVAHGVEASAVETVDNIKGQTDEHDEHIAPGGVQNLCIFHEEGEDLAGEEH